MPTVPVTSWQGLCTGYFVPLKIRRGESPFLGGGSRVLELWHGPAASGVENTSGGGTYKVSLCVTKPLP